jgi:translation initiation factor IF-2
MKIQLTESELISLIESIIGKSNDFLYEDIYGSVESVDNYLNEAEYQGRKVQLGKIMQGDIKKFKVYVKNDKGKVVKVNFGFGGKSAKGKRMVIKKNNPARRRSFRARHNCDNPGPRWKPRYWACKTW